MGKEILYYGQIKGFPCDKLAVNSVINNYMEIHIFY